MVSVGQSAEGYLRDKRLLRINASKVGLLESSVRVPDGGVD